MYKVTNTIDGTSETFKSMEDVNTHIGLEIIWFNSPNESKNNNGYDESDFIIDSL